MSNKLAGSSEKSAVPVVYPVFAGKTGTEHGQERQRAYTAGHAAGYTAGIRRAAQENELLRNRLEADHAALTAGIRESAAAQFASLRAAAAAFSSASLPVLADAEQTLLECALALAGAVLGQELDDFGSSSRTALTRALAGSGPTAPVRVRMNPFDVASLEAASREAASLERTAPVLPELVADSSLSRGDAVAEFEDGFLDARISTALARAQNELQRLNA